MSSFIKYLLTISFIKYLNEIGSYNPLDPKYSVLSLKTSVIPLPLHLFIGSPPGS